MTYRQAESLFNKQLIPKYFQTLYWMIQNGKKCRQYIFNQSNVSLLNIMLEGVIIIGLHSSDREALDEQQAGLQLADAVLDLAVGPGQGGERVLHLPHSGQEVIRGREAGADTGGGWGGQLPAPGYPGQRGRAAPGL